MEAKGPIDDHENLAKESWHPMKESANYVETNADKRCIKGEIAEVEQLVDDDMKAKSSVDDHKNLADKSWHSPRESANYVETDTDMRCIKGVITQVEQLVDNDMKAKSPVDDHENLADKSWHPFRESASYVETVSDMKCIKGELAKVELLVDIDIKAKSPVDDHTNLAKEYFRISKSHS